MASLGQGDRTARQNIWQIMTHRFLHILAVLFPIVGSYNLLVSQEHGELIQRNNRRNTVATKLSRLKYTLVEYTLSQNQQGSGFATYTWCAGPQLRGRTYQMLHANHQV